MASEKYDHKKIEKKWQKEWIKTKLYKTSESRGKKKFYVLDMFPYPSGEGLHVGHPRGYIGTDIFSRFKKMSGHNVLHPMGWDAFGLPAEQYAIKHKMHPEIAVKKNIKRYKEQLSIIGFNYDWEREVNTTDPEFYKWTQWTFLQMLKKGLAYESFEPINWCPSCQTGLANEDLENGLCERCGSEVEQKPMRQWVLKITDYADRMLADLGTLNWPESIKESQRNWIGRSEGSEIDFRIKNSKERIKVFTTRADTLFGVTYVVLAPEHPLVKKLQPEIKNWNEVEKYIDATKYRSEIERAAEKKDKTGVELKGVKAINPATGEEIPVWIADYVLAHYGTGAVMAVPAHDERDFEFAKNFGLQIRPVILPTDPQMLSVYIPEGLPETNEDNYQHAPQVLRLRLIENPYLLKGILFDSGTFNGLTSEVARKEITKQFGTKKVTYKLKDWVFSRQRYWGEPIPVIHCLACGVVPVPEKELPVILPKVKSYEPSGTGESPLATIDKWVNVKCPNCKSPAKRETNTMPQWAGSSWYYLRYIDPKNKKALVDKKKEKYWSPVDMYVGGTEHATRHLIYARFWHKFLYDIKVVNHLEPFSRLQNQGMILASDGRKMSKRWGNVVNPDEIVGTYGADTLRLYEMFMGPFDQSVAWNTDSIMGARRFIEKVWRLQFSAVKKIKNKNPDLEKSLHKTIKKVTEDIETMSFNTAVSSMMILANEMDKAGEIDVEMFKMFLQILAPFAPHVTDEIWHALGERKSVHVSDWPKFNANKIIDDTFTLVVQVNGKVRAEMNVSIDATEEVVKKLVFSDKIIQQWISDKEIIKFIYVKGKLANIVV